MNFKIITYNWQIKVLTVFVAIGMWIYAASTVTTIAKFPSSIPIKEINLSPGLVAVYDQKSVEIDIAAEPTVWNQLSIESFTAYLDFTGLSGGTHSIPVNITTTVSGVQIVTKNPASLMVTIEPSAEKDVPVIALISGSAAENMIAGEINFNPATVKAIGPKSIIDGLGQATAEIVLSGEAESFSKSVKVVALDNKGKPISYVNFLPQSVTADVKIVKAGNVKNVGIKVITTGVPASGFYVSAITTNPATLNVIGTADALRSLSAISTQPIDISNLNKNTTVKAMLSVPVGVQIDGGATSVSVTINVANAPVSRTITVVVKTKNLPAGLKVASISPQTIDVVVSGPSDAIAGVSPDSISLVLDLSEAVVGANTAGISSSNFSLPADTSLVSFQPQQIVVTLQ